MQFFYLINFKNKINIFNFQVYKIDPENLVNNLVSWILYYHNNIIHVLK
jgi:hypothetical protein